jgi:hypothetical protein
MDQQQGNTANEDSNLLSSQFLNSLMASKLIVVNQRHELGEIFGFETRNKYQLFDENNKILGFAAEQQKGIFGFF